MSESHSEPKSEITAEICVRPVCNILGDISGLIADWAMSVLAMFYSSPVGKKANVALSELITNVLENISSPGGLLQVRLHIDGERLMIAVTNDTPKSQADNVRQRIEELNATANPRKLFADTIRARRGQQLKGGIGLMRLVVENKFKLSTDYDGELLTVRAEYQLEATP
jgi:hypothetical protein